MGEKAAKIKQKIKFNVLPLSPCLFIFFCFIKLLRNCCVQLGQSPPPPCIKLCHELSLVIGAMLYHITTTTTTSPNNNDNVNNNNNNNLIIMIMMLIITIIIITIIIIIIIIIRIILIIKITIIMIIIL